MAESRAIKNISWGCFQFTEWATPWQDKEIKNFSLSHRVYNKETKESETQSTLQLNRKQDISIIHYLLKKVLKGKYEEMCGYRTYKNEENQVLLAKSYTDKEGVEKEQVLVIKFMHDFLVLLDLLERLKALFIIPIKSKSNKYGASNISNNGNNGVNPDLDEELDDEIPF